MIADQIRLRAQRLYLPFLRAAISGEPFFPKKISFRKIDSSSEFGSLQEEVAKLREMEKADGRLGPSVVYETKNTLKYGKQSLPVDVWFETADDFLSFTGRQKEFEHFAESACMIKSKLTELGLWLGKNSSPAKILNHSGKWADLLLVCRFFLDHPVKTYYLRELPIPVHTKFIEENAGILRDLLENCLPPDRVCWQESSFEKRFGLRHDMPLIRFRILDASLQKRLSIPFSDFSCLLGEAARLLSQIAIGEMRFFIAENKMNFLTLPESSDAIAVFGSGCMVEMLSSFSFMERAQIYYWGDIDVQGFEILSRLRATFPHVQSFLMSADVLEKFRQFAGQGVPSVQAHPEFLSADEAELYRYLKSENLRLEQEKVPQSEVKKAISRI